MQPEVVVVGGGPAGTSAAYWLGAAGHDVLVVERTTYPRDKTCGDGITPRAGVQLDAMDVALGGLHPVDGVDLVAGRRRQSFEWPPAGRGPTSGVLRRSVLDEALAHRAREVDVTFIEGAEATPVREGSRIAVDVDGRIIRPSRVVIADGARSSFGRRLGIVRDRGAPLGLAARAYFASPRSSSTRLECHLDVRDAAGSTIPGYGWVFPAGDGTVNVGIIYLTTAGRWRGPNTYELMAAFVAGVRQEWRLEGEARSLHGGMLPAGLGIGPRSGPSWLAVGDAAGAINPFSGEGISYALETGRLGAEHVHRSLTGGGSRAMLAYGRAVDDRYGRYYRTAKAYVSMFARPTVARLAAHAIVRSARLTTLTMTAMLDMVPTTGLPAAMYSAVERLANSRG